MRRRGQATKIVYILLVVLLIGAILFSGVKLVEHYTSSGEQEVSEGSSTALERDGKKYFPRYDITVVLLMGIDRAGPVEATDYRNGGNADMMALMVFDETNQTVNVLSLNRDTMALMDVYGIDGKYMGKETHQLAISHNYRTGMKDSCMDTSKAVSDLLYGLDIDYYVAMNLDAISMLTDAVGGVSVMVEDDFSQVDPTIIQGQINKLTGEQAILFVQNRMEIGNTTNLSRMERQKEFMRGFFDAFQGVIQEDAQVMEIYESVSPYMVTDMIPKSITNLLNKYRDYSLGEFWTLEGENVLQGEHYAYILDEEKLDAFIIEHFYQAQ